MNLLRTLTVPALLSLTLALGACGGGSSNGAGGTSGAAGGSSGSGTSNPNNLACMSSSSTGACTQAEIDAYSNCILGACDVPLQTCYGPGYKTGQFGGTCGTWAACTSKCACGDTACRTACGATPAACTSCLSSSLLSCALSCSIPACYLGGAGGTSGSGLGGAFGGLGGASGSVGGTCADLLACCNKAQGTFKTACTLLYSTTMPSGDAACGQVVAAAKSTYCP